MSIRKNRGALFPITVPVMLAVLELGKHTIIGWVMALFAMVCFCALRSKKLPRAGRRVRLAAWCGLLPVFTGILWICWPPVRAVSAVEGKTAVKRRLTM